MRRFNALKLLDRSLDTTPRIALNSRATTGADQATIGETLSVTPGSGLTRQGVESTIVGGLDVKVRNRDLETDDTTVNQVRGLAIVGAVPNQVIKRSDIELEDRGRWTFANRTATTVSVCLLYTSDAADE